MQITIAITLPYHQFKEWSKENVKTRTARSRTREGKSWDWDTSKGRSYPIFDFVKPLTHEKHCIQISKHVINHGKIMHMEKKEDKWRKPRSVKDCG
ncbi:hypothetical protein T12_4397 [Trichinella patagoniensis]|uniref:Uncharacterized protein n=1 Tax=Trichinella patagoniensis TaxID=990121 RepID=A0A0V0ZIJ5_9BILA|nr:hypothetical protein T12_4397 [Trichinella patagoniensis]